MFKPTEPIKDRATEIEFERVAVQLNTIIAGRMRICFALPKKPVDGSIVICDGVHWDPLLDGVKRPIWYDGASSTWKKFA